MVWLSLGKKCEDIYVCTTEWVLISMSPHDVKQTQVLLFTNSRWVAPMGHCLHYRWNTPDELGSTRSSREKPYSPREHIGVTSNNSPWTKEEKSKKREESTQTSSPNFWSHKSKRIHCWTNLLTQSTSISWGLGTVLGRRWSGLIHFIED